MNYNSKLKGEKTFTNYEGAKAYAMTPELELYTAVVTASLSDTNYESDDKRVERIAKLISKVSGATLRPTRARNWAAFRDRYRTDCNGRSTVSTSTSLPNTTAAASR